MSGFVYNSLMPEQHVYDYPRPAVAADMVVLSRDGYVLLVRRKSEPFQGQWALPGGFMNIDERLADAAARELEEETGITGLTLRQWRAFDEPGRDPRGRTISVVFLAQVDGRPEAKGGDDAAEARWQPLDRLPRLAFDHDRILAEAQQALGCT